MWQRAVLFVAAICLIKPGWKSDLVGLALWAVVFAVQYLARPKEIDKKPA
jgi:UPF0716 family protein affecting phage T7 exclusion